MIDGLTPFLTVELEGFAVGADLAPADPRMKAATALQRLGLVSVRPHVEGRTGRSVLGQVRLTAAGYAALPQGGRR